MEYMKTRLLLPAVLKLCSISAAAVGRHWKWEGYAEYIARQNNDQKDLLQNLVRFINTDDTQWAIHFSDSTIAPRQYYGYWLLLQYCMDIKKMTYQQMLLTKQLKKKCGTK